MIMESPGELAYGEVELLDGPEGPDPEELLLERADTGPSLGHAETGRTHPLRTNSAGCTHRPKPPLRRGGTGLDPPDARPPKAWTHHLLPLQSPVPWGLV